MHRRWQCDVVISYCAYICRLMPTDEIHWRCKQFCVCNIWADCTYVCIRVLREQRSEDTLSRPLWCDVHDHDVTREVRVLILRFELHIYVHYVQMLINLKNIKYHRQSINQSSATFIHRFFHLCVMSSRVWWWWHHITWHDIIILGKAKALRSLSNGNQ